MLSFPRYHTSPFQLLLNCLCCKPIFPAEQSCCPFSLPKDTSPSFSPTPVIFLWPHSAGLRRPKKEEVSSTVLPGCSTTQCSPSWVRGWMVEIRHNNPSIFLISCNVKSGDFVCSMVQFKLNLELVIYLHLPAKCWDYSSEPLHCAEFEVFKMFPSIWPCCTGSCMEQACWVCKAFFRKAVAHRKALWANPSLDLWVSMKGMRLQ